MPMRSRHVALGLIFWLGCSSGSSGGGGDGGGVDGPVVVDASDETDAELGGDAAPRPDAPTPAPPDVSNGPADRLLIDRSVHPSQVWGEPFDFRMAAYPRTWAIAVVHASMLLRSRCIEFSPDAVMSIALKESKLACTTAGSPSILDGCFQIESTSAYTELRAMFGSRFAGEHSAIISGPHFETSALAMAHYLVFSSAMMRKYHACPRAYFAAHPDRKTEHKVLCGAYNRGLWWASLPEIFTTCASRDVLECFHHDIATDHASAIADYAVGLQGAPVFDAQVSWSDLEAYWTSIRPMYTEVDSATVTAALRRAFDSARGAAATISFKDHIRVVLTALIGALPAFPTVAEAQARACERGYLSGAACDASSCACAP